MKLRNILALSSLSFFLLACDPPSSLHKVSSDTTSKTNDIVAPSDEQFPRLDSLSLEDHGIINLYKQYSKNFINELPAGLRNDIWLQLSYYDPAPDRESAESISRKIYMKLWTYVKIIDLITEYDDSEEDYHNVFYEEKWYKEIKSWKEMKKSIKAQLDKKHFPTFVPQVPAIIKKT